MGTFYLRTLETDYSMYITESRLRGRDKLANGDWGHCGLEEGSAGSVLSPEVWKDAESEG